MSGPRTTARPDASGQAPDPPVIEVTATDPTTPTSEPQLPEEALSSELPAGARTAFARVRHVVTDRGRRLFLLLGDRLLRAGRAARRAWQHSLQLRVGATTLVVTGIGVLLIGIFLVNQISAGVLRAKRTAAVLQATAGLDTVRRVFADVSPGDIPSQNAAVTSAQSQLSATGSEAGLFTITIESANTSVSAGSQNSPEIPKSLRCSGAGQQPGRAVRPDPAAKRLPG